MKKFRIIVPTLVKLEGLEIPVQYVDHIPEYGLYESDSKRISISTTHHTHKEQVLDTLHHELMHAVFDHTGLSKICPDISDNFEEMVVTALENYFKNAILLDQACWLKTDKVSFTVRKESS